MAHRIETHFIAGPAGQLEALLEEPDSILPPAQLCVVCHPHPLGGGTMINKVVHRIAKAMWFSGRVVLRFNFRGVGRSEGEHAGGVGEVEDARAALRWLQSRYPGLPYSLAGFSFGSRVILMLGCELGDANHLYAVGFPTKREPLPFLRKCSVPKTFISSTNDEFAPWSELEEAFEAFSGPKRLIWVEAKDHFFAGALERLQAELEAAAEE